MKVAVFICNWGAYSALEAAGRDRLPLPEGLHFLKVPCLGRLNPGLVLRAFEYGADGVLLVGCPEGECHYRTGSDRATDFFAQTRALVKLLGLGESHLRFVRVGVGQGKDFASHVEDFMAGLKTTPEAGR